MKKDIIKVCELEAKMSKINKLKHFCVKLQELSELFVTKHSVMAGFEMKSPNKKLAYHTAYKYLESCPQQLYTYPNAASKQFLLNTFKKNALKKMSSPLASWMIFLCVAGELPLEHVFLQE